MKYFVTLFSPETHALFSASDRTQSGYRARQRKAAERVIGTSASLPSGSQGGRNPMQLGLGVQLADIGRNFAQGALANTGRTFDLALNGGGHFMVTDGINTLFTRVGTFGLDARGDLVDQRTGYRVIGQKEQFVIFAPSDVEAFR